MEYVAVRIWWHKFCLKGLIFQMIDMKIRSLTHGSWLRGHTLCSDWCSCCFQPHCSESCSSPPIEKVFRWYTKPFSTPDGGEQLWTAYLQFKKSKKDCQKKNVFYVSVPASRQSTLSASPHVFAIPRQTEPETQEVWRAAEVFQNALQVLKNRATRRHERDVAAAGRAE